MSERAWYFPELHDVSPSQRDALDAMLGCLDDRARAAAAVLVVPDWGGMAPIDADEELAATLRSLGGAKVMHGLTHALGPRLWDRVMYGTLDEGEFARLARADALARLREASRRFTTALGAPPRWFCAPRWLTSAGTLDALRELGIRGVMHRERCTLPTGGTAEVPALWFDDGRRAWTRAGAALVRARTVERLLRARAPFRLALHPRDVRDARVRREIATLLDTLAREGWEPHPLDDLARLTGAVA